MEVLELSGEQPIGAWLKDLTLMCNVGVCEMARKLEVSETRVRAIWKGENITEKLLKRYLALLQLDGEIRVR